MSCGDLILVENMLKVRRCWVIGSLGVWGCWMIGRKCVEYKLD